MQGCGRGRQTSILNLTASPAVLGMALADHTLLCFAMLCYAMLCYAILYYAICTGVRALLVYLNISNYFLWTCIIACGS